MKSTSFGHKDLKICANTGPPNFIRLGNFTGQLHISQSTYAYTISIFFYYIPYICLNPRKILSIREITHGYERATLATLPLDLWLRIHEPCTTVYRFKLTGEHPIAMTPSSRTRLVQTHISNWYRLTEVIVLAAHRLCSAKY